MKRFLSAAFSGVVIVLAGCSTPAPAPEPASLPRESIGDSVEEYGLSLQGAFELAKAGEHKKANTLLQSLLPDPRFAFLRPELQYYWLHMSAALAYQQRELDYACVTFRKASDTSYATVQDWYMRFFCASRRKDYADGIRTLETALHRWPNALDTFEYVTVSPFVSEVLRSDIPARDQQALLELLFAENWRTTSGIEPSGFWVKLARMYVEQGQLERAKTVALRVTAPRAVLAMRVSRQFEALVNALPDHFNLSAAIERYSASLEESSRASPRRLAIKSSYIDALNNTGNYERVLAVIDEALAGDKGSSRYDDAGELLQWIFNARAIAMKGLGRFDEAERSYLQGIAVSFETPNVSQTINLAQMYVDLQRWDQAEAKVREIALLESGISEYGKMQVHVVLLETAIGKKDESAVATALDKLRAMQSTSFKSFQAALLDAHRMDEAATLLIARLRDPKLREDALLDVQDYRLASPAPGERRSRDLWHELRSRSDVQAAVAEVGRIEAVPLSR